MITDSLGSARSLRAESLIVVHNAQAKNIALYHRCYALIQVVLSLVRLRITLERFSAERAQ